LEFHFEVYFNSDWATPISCRFEDPLFDLINRLLIQFRGDRPNNSRWFGWVQQLRRGDRPANSADVVVLVRPALGFL